MFFLVSFRSRHLFLGETKMLQNKLYFENLTNTFGPLQEHVMPVPLKNQFGPMYSASSILAVERSVPWIVNLFAQLHPPGEVFGIGFELSVRNQNSLSEWSLVPSASLVGP